MSEIIITYGSAIAWGAICYGLTFVMPLTAVWAVGLAGAVLFSGMTAKFLNRRGR